MVKDNFSDKSDLYKKYRPEYPLELFDFIFKNISDFENAWDCATGNGQVAKCINNKFKNVYATDISSEQIKHAEKLDNVFYSIQQAEKTNFQDNFFDLIIVGQAVHWFNFDHFYSEVKRTLKEKGIIVVLGYGQFIIDDNSIDEIINKELYHDILDAYWDKERKYIDKEYKTIPFPFYEIESPKFEINYNWSLEHLLGYLNTWSGVKHYQKAKSENPVDIIKYKLIDKWNNRKYLNVKFPILIRIGKLNNH